MNSDGSDAPIPDEERRLLSSSDDKYQNDWIRTRVYGWKDGSQDSEKYARIEVWSGSPPTNFFGVNLGMNSELLRTWCVRLPATEFEGQLEDTLETAKTFIRGRSTDCDSARESAEIATERAFPGGDDE
ncbi:hypothetical protein ACFQE1_04380 [Halobium palmae]|uniref:Uncharacterized protein n=1 Tax=Halobium palmae TaxID=1776492 RepID=A0ABD5RWC6_9EURY